MESLKDKRYITFDYTSRYASVPCYYHTVDKKEIQGLGKNMQKGIAWVAHNVVSTDTLDKLALTYYNNPTYWWIIAYFNDIQDAFINLKDYFDVLKIPAITNISFADLR
jgi:nucleoid-associated protein YgaU